MAKISQKNAYLPRFYIFSIDECEHLRWYATYKLFKDDIFLQINIVNNMCCKIRVFFSCNSICTGIFHVWMNSLCVNVQFDKRTYHYEKNYLSSNCWLARTIWTFLVQLLVKKKRIIFTSWVSLLHFIRYIFCILSHPIEKLNLRCITEFRACID